MRIGYLGAGTWGFCLALQLARNGHEVFIWDNNPAHIERLREYREHPNLPGYKAPSNIRFVSRIEDVLKDIDFLVESVTAAGIRPVFLKLKELNISSIPIVLTSKGIDQQYGLLLPELVELILGESYRNKIVCLSGPSHAEEVILQHPTSVVCAGNDKELMKIVRDAFSTKEFRIYFNSDVRGVSFGGAVKNVVAIACGVSDGLGFGDNTKAALMTRGLHEIRKLSVAIGCNSQTLTGLSGIGDLCVTCLSGLSRNYQFGQLLAQGFSPKESQDKIVVVVEGAYTSRSVHDLGRKNDLDLPIIEAVYNMIYHELEPKDAVQHLLSRPPREERL